MRSNPQMEVAGSTAGQRQATQPRIAPCFYVDCTVCGRRLRVLVEHRGQRLACGHCGCRFDAVDPTSNVPAGPSMMERAAQLLLRCASRQST